jgi:putative ABC transport system permease protein
MDSFWQDVRYGLRSLLKTPGFTLLAVLILALGVGANTAIFSFMNSLFLRPLRLPEPDRIVRLYGASAHGRQFDIFSYANYADLRDRSTVFSGLAAHQNVTVSLNAGGEPENIAAELVTGNYFETLGVPPALGRTLTPQDDVNEGGHPVAVISSRLWKRRFNASTGVVGEKILLNGHPFDVIGVAAESFRGTYDATPSDLWVPMMMHEQVRPRGIPLAVRAHGWLFGTGRLKPGVTLEQAQAEVSRISANFREEKFLEKDANFALSPSSALPGGPGRDMSRGLGFLIALVNVVLLVGCANIGGFMLARGMARRRETAIRQSLGASRFRLVRQLLTESLLLALMGGACGLLAAVWMKDGMMALVPPDMASFSPMTPLDGRVLAFTSLVTLLLIFVFGLPPALQASKSDVISVLKEEGATPAGGRRRSRLQSAFVVGQVSLSLVLLVVAGLFLHSFVASADFQPGFNTEKLVLASFRLKNLGIEEQRGRAFVRQLTERMRALPGVQAASYAMVVPLGGSEEGQGYRIPGVELPPGKNYISIANDLVGPDYFSTMGIPLAAGRAFEARDFAAGAQPVIVVNATMARSFWPGKNPVGQVVLHAPDGPALQIVGVVMDITYYSLGEEPRPYLYAPFSLAYADEMTIHIRAAGDPAPLLPMIKKEAAVLEPNVPVTVTTFAALRRDMLFPARLLAASAGILGGLALLLTGLGIFALVSYAVGLRTQEIGIRMAMGAQHADILGMILRKEMALLAIGAALGLAAASALARVLAKTLFGVKANDPVTFTGVILLLGMVALAACYFPARRATRVDPLVALRHE